MFLGELATGSITAPIAPGDPGDERQETVPSVDKLGDAFTKTLPSITLPVSGVITEFATKNGNFSHRER